MNHTNITPEVNQEFQPQNSLNTTPESNISSITEETKDATNLATIDSGKQILKAIEEAKKQGRIEAPATLQTLPAANTPPVLPATPIQQKLPPASQ